MTVCRVTLSQQPLCSAAGTRSTWVALASMASSPANWPSRSHLLSSSSTPATIGTLPRDVKATITGFLGTSERLLSIGALDHDWRRTLAHPLAWETTVLYNGELLDHYDVTAAGFSECLHDGVPYGELNMLLVEHLVNLWSKYNIAPRKLVMYGDTMDVEAEEMFTALLSSGVLSHLNHLVIGSLFQDGEAHDIDLLHDFLASLTQLSSLTFFVCDLEQLHMPPLASLHELTFFDCSLKRVTGLDKLPSLQYARFDHCQREKAITLPASLRCIQYLGPDVDHVTPFVRSVLALPAVRSVQFTPECGWDNMLRAGARQTHGWSELVSLRCNHGPLVKESALCALAAKCSKLESLIIRSDLSVNAMRHFTSFKSLTELRLYDSEGDKFSDEHLRELTRLPKLRKLVLDSAPNFLSLLGIPTFAQMRALRSLHLHRCIGMCKLEGIEQCTQLEEFSFYPVGEMYKLVLTARPPHKNKKNVDVDDIPYRLHINDARAISRISGLRVLKLFVPPDEEGMRQLSTLQRLTKLVIRRDPEGSDYPVHLDYPEVSHVLFGFPNLKKATLAAPSARFVRDIYRVSDLYSRIMQKGVDLYVQDVFTEERHKEFC